MRALWRVSASCALLLPCLAGAALWRHGASDGQNQPPQPLPGYVTRWVGNTFEGAGVNGEGRWVQNYVDEIEVTPDGAVITASTWDEAGRCTGIYKGGDVNRDLLKQYQGRGGHTAWGWGTASEAVAVEGNFIFIANTSNELLRFRWNPNHIHEYTYLDQVALGGEKENTAVGMSARDGLLYILRKSGEVQVRRTADLSLVRQFTVPNARDVAVSHRGDLWLIVGDQIHRYSPAGTRLPGTIADAGKPTALAIGNDRPFLIVCDDGARQQVLFYDISQPASPKRVRRFGAQGGLRSGTPGEVTPFKLFALRGAGTDSQGNLYVAMGLVMGETVIRQYTPAGRVGWEVACHAFVDCFYPVEVAPRRFELYGSCEILTFDPSQPAGKGWKLKAVTRDHIRYPDDPRNREPWGGVFLRVLQGRRVLYTTPQMGGGFRLFVFEPAPSQVARYVGEISLPHVELWARYVDSRGDLWLSDGRRILRYPFRGFDAKGNPQYDTAQPETWDAPAPFTEVARIRYLPETDTLYLSGYTAEVSPPSWGLMGGVLARYDGWMRGNRIPRYTLQMPRDDEGLFPKEFTVAGEYLFAAMVRGGYGRSALVYVFRVEDGKQVGVLFPGHEVGGNSGWIDMVHGIHALKASDGTYLVVVEEDWRGKNIVYVWKPSTLVPTAAQGAAWNIITHQRRLLP
ncbi:MAG: hypothetical protein RMK92_05960 [Armatimonadota bacterium]|nr:hypothetical protein [Armatimonadota bacterium]